jgi:hypothetical protein
LKIAGFARLKNKVVTSFENAFAFSKLVKPPYMLPKEAIQAQQPGKAEKIRKL